MLEKFIRTNPKNAVLFTVPHAGDFYPNIFIQNLKLKLNKVRKIEDFQSNRILDLMDFKSADVIIAKCSRVVVDLNRSRNAIDNDMFINRVNTHHIDEKKMISFGLGVFPKIILSENIFENKLPVSYANFILENYYDKKISSMNLLVLHPNYTNYVHLKLPEMKKEAAFLIEQAKELSN